MLIITDEQRRKTKLLFGAKMEKARSLQKLIQKLEQQRMSLPKRDK